MVTGTGGDRAVCAPVMAWRRLVCIVWLICLLYTSHEEKWSILFKHHDVKNQQLRSFHSMNGLRRWEWAAFEFSLRPVSVDAFQLNHTVPSSLN